MGRSRVPTGWRLGICAISTVLACLSCTAQATGAALSSAETRVRKSGPGAPGFALPGVPTPGSSTEQQTGSVAGSVTDSDGRLLPGARVTLTDALGVVHEAAADADGEFSFAGLPAGDVQLAVAAAGFAPVIQAKALKAGETLDLGAVVLANAVATTTVEVTKTREELAEAEIHQQEHQRVLGVVPNFFVSYTWDAQPLTRRQKFELDAKTLRDPVNIGLNAGIAGLQQLDDAFPGYGSGPVSYFKRFGANLADFAIGTTLGGAVLPSLLHQDPRYFYKGTGSRWSRLGYALSTAVRQRGDNGKWQVGYSSMLGDIASGAISNVYYPASDRHGATLTLENGFLSIAFDGIGNVVQEFLFKPFSTGVKK